MKVLICLFAAVAAVSAAWVGDYSGHGGFSKQGFVGGFGNGGGGPAIVKGAVAYGGFGGPKGYAAGPVAGFGGGYNAVHGAGFAAGPIAFKGAAYGGFGGPKGYIGGPVAGFGGYGAVHGTGFSGPMGYAAGPVFIKSIGPATGFGGHGGYAKAGFAPVGGPVGYGGFGHGGAWKKH